MFQDFEQCAWRVGVVVGSLGKTYGIQDLEHLPQLDFSHAGQIPNVQAALTRFWAEMASVFGEGRDSFDLVLATLAVLEVTKRVDPTTDWRGIQIEVIWAELKWPGDEWKKLFAVFEGLARENSCYNKI